MHDLGVAKNLRLALWLASILLFLSIGDSWALQGLCSNCHTMHNSQNNQPMEYSGGGPRPMLLRGDCVGCHAQGKNSEIVNGVPQVLHSASRDLAGGNFAYITGMKLGGDGGFGDAYGHNVVSIPGIAPDGTLGATGAPGGNFAYGNHPGNEFVNNPLRCAGAHGCHGDRMQPDMMQAIRGAHHRNVRGLVNGTSVADSFRFLLGVKGYEVDDWLNLSPKHHNEYYGLKSPVNLAGCRCHMTAVSGGTMIPAPPSGTISQFCATCHPLFHSSNSTASNPNAPGSPWLRHPTDYALPAAGEYAGYNNGTLTYSILAPVARTTWPIQAISDRVTPGEDAVMCLSCHYAHAGPYPDALRWDYRTCVAGGNANGACGCFVCHTTKP